MFCVTALTKTFYILLTAVVNELLAIRYDTIRYDTMVYINVRLKADEYSQLNLPHGTKQKRIMKKLKTKNGDAQKKSVESVLRLEGSLWWERFVKEVVLEPGLKERERELWMVTVVSHFQVLQFHVLHFHVLHFHARGCRWSVIFMPSDLVRHFQVVHFQSAHLFNTCMCHFLVYVSISVRNYHCVSQAVRFNL